LGLQLNAGAGGRHLSNGVRIEGYLTTSTISGGVLFPYAVGSPGRQEVFAFSNRSFHVDSNQDAKLSGLAGGAINDPEFSQPPFLRADYEWEGKIILDEIVTRQDIPQVLQSWLIGFNDMINNGPQELRVSLRTQDENGDPISYTLRTVLDLESLLLNYNFPEETQAGDIPVGALGSLGAMNSPLWIETALELPHAEFAGNPVSGRKPLQVTFTDKSTSEMTSWEWNFGDGSPISNEKNPHHTYSKVGTYTVSLTATGPLGADTETKTGYITVTRPNTGVYDLLLHSDP
jgi:hypothetical protein